jgi:hypothetical protein
MWTILTFLGFLVSIVIDGFYSKNLPKETRGILISFNILAAFSGKAIAIKLGSYLFNNVGRNGPFYMIGICDLLFCGFVIIMIKMNKYGNLKKLN